MIALAVSMTGLTVGGFAFAVSDAALGADTLSAGSNVALAQERRRRRRRRHEPAPRRRRRPRLIPTERGGPRLAVVRRLETGLQPKSVQVSPDGSRVVVCNFGRPDRDNVFVYDSASLERVGTVKFPGNAVESAFSPDGRTLYVSNFRRHVVEEIDLERYVVRREIRVGTNPKFMVMSPDGRRLYVANWSDRTVSIIDTASGTQERLLSTGVHPRGLAVLPDGRLLAASFHSDFIQVFSAEGDELSRFETCEFPRHLQVGPDPSGVYVTCTLGTISRYDVDTGRRVALSRTGQNPRSLGISSDGRFLATANFHSSDVSLADFALGTHRTSEVPGADQLVGLAIQPGDGLRVYATSWNTAELLVLEPTRPLPPVAAPGTGVAPSTRGAGVLDSAP